METLVKAAQLILSISVLVILHELGHFIPAKLFKIKVERFFLFFDPWIALFKKKIKGTVYGIGWIPLGGYVKLAGMTDESLDKEQMKKPPQPWEFRSKPAWQRLIVMIGGVSVNVLLSIVIFSSLIFKYGTTSLPVENLKYGIAVNEIGRGLGLENGDKILSINDIKPKNFHEIPINIALGDYMDVERNGKLVKLSLEGDKKKELLGDTKKPSRSFILPRTPAIIGAIQKGSGAQKAGLRAKDELVGISSKPILFSDEVKALLTPYKNQEISLSINREGDLIEKKVRVDENGLLGVHFSNFAQLDEIFKLEKKEFSFLESIPMGAQRAWNVLSVQIKSLKQVFNPQTEAYKQVGSFFSIGKMFSGNWNWETWSEITAVLSIWLAFINILPIPSLDGGYVLFTLIEIVRGKKMGEKFLERAIAIGVSIMGALMIVVLGWDIFKTFFK